jgi:surface protein
VYLAQDDDFVKVNNRWVYRGSELEIEIPHVIQGENVTSYFYMFYGTQSYLGNYLATPVTRVDSNNKNVTSMNYMFASSSATTLDLSSFDTSNVTNMANMFRDSKASTLDLSNFDTSNVTSMESMFRDSKASTLDLSSFDTSNVTRMDYMFYNSIATTLDLSSFDTSNVTNMANMFRGSSATTGYARTQADADRFNASSYKPAGLNFVVKP